MPDTPPSSPQDKLFAPSAPGFDRPIDLLLACHDRIRKHTGLLRTVAERAEQGEITDELKDAITRVLRYFDESVQHHHLDEEQDLFPVLMERAGGDSPDPLDVVEALREQHRELNDAWANIRQELHELASGGGSAILRAEAIRFQTLYEHHLEKEEAELFPLARRVLRAEDLARLSRSMKERRGTTLIKK